MKKFFSPSRLLSLLTLITFALIACSPLQTALLFTDSKTAEYSNTLLDQKATNTFWEAFHAGQYERLKEVRTLLLAAYLEHPRNPDRSRLLGLSYLWTLSERGRVAGLGPEVTDSAILAERYLSETYQLEPSDHRLPGFIGVLKLALGSIHQDPKQTVKGYYTILDAVKLYPEFNGFVLSLGLSEQPIGSERFNESVDAMWKNLAICNGETINKNPDLATMTAQNQAFLDRASQLTPRVRNVCLNTDKAPHNFEGFFLHFGDVLVKQGQVKAAKIMYAQAKLSPTYNQYPYKKLLEQHLEFADDRAKAYQNPDPSKYPEMAGLSSVQCMICHQSK